MTYNLETPMNRPRLSKTPLALAVTILFLHAASALAQDAAPAPAASASVPAIAASSPAADPMSLDRVVVTGASVAGTKMRQSLSISTLEGEQLTNAGVTSIAEALRLVPGVHSENSGGEGNANVTVRGVPISAGGSRYVQFQEDGLPVLLFGDIAFGTPDQFLRADYSLDHVEVVRGGSASTLASNSPGGLINFISKTGEDDGGAIGYSEGIGRAGEHRLDVDYGGKLGAHTTFHIGAFDRQGEGGRPTGYDAASGGQLKANVTHKFSEGFVRVYFKALDDRTPTFLPVPVTVSGGHIERLPAIDPRTAYFIGPSFPADNVMGPDGNTVSTNPRDGLHVRSTALGAEAQFDLGGGWSLDDKFRRASNSGRFIGLFPTNNGDGATPATSTTFTGALFNTSINDLGNTVNDLKLTRSFGAFGPIDKAALVAGLFDSRQEVALTWFWNTYTVQMASSQPTATLAGSGWDTFGGCCVRNFDVSYVNTAPYAALTVDSGPLTIDASLRRDVQRASGWAESGNGQTRSGWDTAHAEPVHYSLGHTAYSIGANLAASKSLAFFARASDGEAFGADRLLYGNPLDGSVPISINEVKQLEGGAKWHRDTFNLFATLFQARTSESNYEATTQTFTANRYKATGLELEAGYSIAALRLAGGLTLTHSRITASNDPTTIGHTPRRLARTVLEFSPSYSLGDFEFGATALYTGKSYGDDANTITLPAYTQVNGFVTYHLSDRAQLGLTVNNLTNAIGYTEIEGDGHAARAINGRTALASLKYSF
jgi:outer membrane receptor protein involved in Fe transport